MGGFSFFITLILAISFLKLWDLDRIGLNLVAALSVIFVVGLKDDLVLSSPRAKLGAEIFAFSIVVFSSGLQFTSLDGFLGIYEVPEVLLKLFLFFMLVFVINAFNLLDGIDGLASTIAIIIFSIYSLVFYATGLYFYFLLCLSLIGVLLAYLKYNLSNTNKIFMGDTGSLIIGFCISFLTLKFIEMDTSLFSHFSFKAENKLIIVAAILFIPIFDTLRVICIRLLKRKSPFYPDRNHIHHVLVDAGLSHTNVTLLIGLTNYCLVIAIIYLSSLLKSYEMLMILLAVFLGLLLVFYLIKKKLSAKQNKSSPVV
jgi:UDP-N-acetylmuramyl pentapeptide phosphotransferase/UDP-N-acetylglucosamine-1-phosphate transferase